MSRIDQPKLDTAGQIQHLLSKGVKFELISLEEAATYLQENNNYFKLRAYRKNFQKHPDGPHKGEYYNLDFEKLRDLAIIDMRLRYVLIHMALDIEHFAKVKLIHFIEQSDEDGYQIVQDYMDKLEADDLKNDQHRKDALKNEIDRNKNNPYCGGIIKKYNDDYPVWAFVEIVPFGTLLNFYLFCADRLNRKELRTDYYLLKDVKLLRNACAHNNCIIYNMGAKDSLHQVGHDVDRSLNGISKSSRKRHLGNEKMREIVTLLYAHKHFVHSSGVRNRASEDLTKLIARMYRNIHYYSTNENITSSFDFFQTVVDILCL